MSRPQSIGKASTDNGQTQQKKAEVVQRPGLDYGDLLAGISDLLERARRMSARAVNNIITATYWEVGRRIVEFEQGGKARAEYGEQLLKVLSRDLTTKHGRGYSRTDLCKMRLFYMGWEICQNTVWQIRGLGETIPQCKGRQRHFPDAVGRIGSSGSAI